MCIRDSHWRLEFFVMAMIAAGALYFAVSTKKISWVIISVGQIFLLMTYPLMLGGYRNTPFELAHMANEIVVVIFVFGNLVFLSGLFVLYLNDQILKKWLRYIAVISSGVLLTAFAIIFVEIISWKEAMLIAPLMNLLYLINAYYGIKIKPERTEGSNKIQI